MVVIAYIRMTIIIDVFWFHQLLGPTKLFLPPPLGSPAATAFIHCQVVNFVSLMEGKSDHRLLSLGVLAKDMFAHLCYFICPGFE